MLRAGLDTGSLFNGTGQPLLCRAFKGQGVSIHAAATPQFYNV